MATVISSQDSTLPSKAEWCFECYRGLAGSPIREAKFRILCRRCERSVYVCEAHVDATKCPGCGPSAHLSTIPASNVSPSTAASDDVAFGLLKDARIEGLAAWLAALSLEKYLPAAILWCHEQGASSLQEVTKNWEQLADALFLKPLEKARMSQDPKCQLPPSSIPKARQSDGPCGQWGYFDGLTDCDDNMSPNYDDDVRDSDVGLPDFADGSPDYYQETYDDYGMTWNTYDEGEW
ncbi:unnamed protein product [Effrenium voratum]|nr:unnamed protein product [Effrenium voratum]